MRSYQGKKQMACYFFKHGRLHVFHGMFFKKKRRRSVFLVFFFQSFFLDVSAVWSAFFVETLVFGSSRSQRQRRCSPPKKKNEKKMSILKKHGFLSNGKYILIWGSQINQFSGDSLVFKGVKNPEQTKVVH